MRLIRKLLFSVFFSGILSVSGQNSDISFETFTISDGLSQSWITCVMQDSRGFLWVGTQDGLNRYDGYSFETYRHDPHDEYSISSNFIQTIVEDSRGNIWVGTQAGLNVFDNIGNNFQTFQSDRSNSRSISNNNIHSVYEDSDNNLWVKTANTIEKFDYQDSTFVFSSYEKNSFSLPSDNITYSLLEDHRGTMWVGTRDGIISFNREIETFDYQLSNRLVIPSGFTKEIRTIFETTQKELLVGTTFGLFLVDRKRMTFVKIPYDGDELPAESNSMINCIYEDSKGKVWIGTEAGLNVYNSNSKKYVIHQENQMNIGAKIKLRITDITEDSTHILWVGTWKGLYKLDGTRRKFGLYRMAKDNSISFSSNDIASIFYDTEKKIIWIGTWDSGLNLFNRTTGENVVINTNTTPKIVDNHVHTIFCDKEKDYWIGTKNGINIYDTEEKKFYTFEERYGIKLIQQIANNNRINAFAQDKNGNIWIATQLGLHCFDIKQRVFESFYQDYSEKKISSNKVTSLAIDSLGKLWVGTIDGLNVYDIENKEFKQYKKRKFSKQSLSNNIIMSIHLAEDNRMWIGTQSGLNCFDRKTNSFEYYTQRDGFANDLIYGILDDSNGDIWVSTNKGISKFDTKEKTIINYDLADGVQSYEFNINSYHKAKNGELFFGGVHGLNTINPKLIKSNRDKPPIALTFIEYMTRDGIRRKYINNVKEVEINSDVYQFTIYFSALDFCRPEKNNYSYLMKNHGNAWINIGNQRYTTFSDISPGDYTFWVRGSNNDLYWNNTGTSIRVIVNPAWYNSIYAYVIYCLSFIGLIIYGFRIRTRVLRRTNAALTVKGKSADEVTKQKDELGHINKNITDSINYANRIIGAMMPSHKKFLSIFPQSFIYHSPKDIVSGDFYWIFEKNEKIFVAAVDCTGHGVPGAFMSIIGFDLLKNITKEQEVENPAEILNKLNDGVCDTFSKDADEDADEDTVNDGMDLAFCVIDRRKQTLEFAGAFNPLYIIRDNNMIEIKADRFSVGLENIKRKKFTNHIIPIEKNDIIYIFSDGYTDQFGGPQGKKFKFRRFRHLLLTIHKLPEKEQEEALRRSFINWQHEQEQVDDVLVIGMNTGQACQDYIKKHPLSFLPY